MTKEQKRLLGAIQLLLENHANDIDNVECKIIFNGKAKECFTSTMGNEFKGPGKKPYRNLTVKTY